MAVWKHRWWKGQRHVKETENRVLRYLKFCCEDDEDELTKETTHFCLGSPPLLCQLVDTMQEELILGPSVQLGYLNAMLELMDFRKVNVCQCPKQLLRHRGEHETRSKDNSQKD